MNPTTDVFTNWVTATFLLSLRLVPVMAFAPPFTLVRAPVLFRILLTLGLGGLMSGALPGTGQSAALSPNAVFMAGVGELFLGSIFATAFHLAFGALYLAGRTVDIQAGYGLAALADPTSQVQTPLVGSIYAYAGAAVFFGLDGHFDLLRIVSVSLDTVPLGQAMLPQDAAPLTAFLGAVFAGAFGVAGGLVVALFLADVAIAMLSRTAPQLNVLVLGFHVKTLIVMVALPMTLGVAGALLARLMATTLEALPALIA